MPTPKRNAVKGLTRFEDRDTLMATIAVTNAGDGLSKALAVEPAEHNLHDTVIVVLQTQVSKIQHTDCSDADIKKLRAQGVKDIPTDGGVKRIHTLRTDLATVIDGDLVADVLEQQRKRNAELEGVIELPLDDERDADED